MSHLSDNWSPASDVVVRAMTDNDDLALLNADNPRTWGAYLWRDLDTGDGVMCWFVAEVDGRPAGFAVALCVPAARGGRAMGQLYVVPQERRRGAGGALLRQVEEAVREAGLPGLLLTWVEGDDAGAAAADAWGLAEAGRHRESVLRLDDIDRDAFLARATRPGLTVAAQPAEVDEQHLRALYDFFAARAVEAPDTADGAVAPPYEVFRSLVTDPWSVVLAADADGTWAGITVVARRPGTPDHVNTFYTGVAPHARGRGVATAVKCHQALLMADAGMTALYTQNMDGNEPILAANRTLGFTVDSGYVDVVRDFDREPRDRGSGG